MRWSSSYSPDSAAVRCAQQEVRPLFPTEVTGLVCQRRQIRVSLSLMAGEVRGIHKSSSWWREEGEGMEHSSEDKNWASLKQMTPALCLGPTGEERV